MQGSVGPVIVGVLIGARALINNVLATLLPQPFTADTETVPVPKPVLNVTRIIVSLMPDPFGCVAEAPAGNNQL